MPPLSLNAHVAATLAFHFSGFCSFFTSSEKPSHDPQPQ